VGWAWILRSSSQKGLLPMPYWVFLGNKLVIHHHLLIFCRRINYSESFKKISSH
jgi:hypothetical protein